MPKKTSLKDPVTIRFRTLANGQQSIYLDIYQHGERHYEFLRLYLWPARRGDRTMQQHNRMVLQQAMAIKAQRTQECLRNNQQYMARPSHDLLLTEWMEKVALKKAHEGQSTKRAETYRAAMKHLNAFLAGRRIKLHEVDRPLLHNFIRYLLTADSRRGGTIRRSTAGIYFATINSALQQACRERLLNENPAQHLQAEARKPLRHAETQHIYLSIDEIKALQGVEHLRGRDTLAAFLFACFTGLRFSDIATLHHSDIRIDGEQRLIVKTMVKTQQTVVIPLSASAKRWLPRHQADDQGPQSDGLVFQLPSFQWTEICLKRMARDVGITKNITFHTARHTFATLQITLGSDLYTVSKLLGHRSIHSTQIYADIVMGKKVEAVSRFDDVFAP